MVLMAGAGAFVEGVAQDIDVGLLRELFRQALRWSMRAVLSRIDDRVVGVNRHRRGAVDHFRDIAANHTLFTRMSIVELHHILIVPWYAHAFPLKS